MVKCKLFVEKREREKEEKERKEEKKEKIKKRKEEKEEGRKEKKSWSTLQQGRLFSYLGDRWSWGLSMAMEFSPNMGVGSKQFECNLCTFSGHFGAG